jgi:NADPH-ferrihemoprotein reductase
MLSVAFSRMKSEKDYVQHHILKHKEEVVKALSAGGYLYVCGDAKSMARDVHAAVQLAVKECNSCSDAEAKEFISNLQNQGRYHQDVW